MQTLSNIAGDETAILLFIFVQSGERWKIDSCTWKECKTDDSSQTGATVVVELIMCPNKTCNTGCVSHKISLNYNYCIYKIAVSIDNSRVEFVDAVTLKFEFQ